MVRLCPELASILFLHSPATLHTLLRGACRYQTNSYYSNTTRTHEITSQVHLYTPHRAPILSTSRMIWYSPFFCTVASKHMLTSVLGWSYGGHCRASWAFSLATSPLWLLNSVGRVLLDRLSVPGPKRRTVQLNSLLRLATL